MKIVTNIIKSLFCVALIAVTVYLAVYGVVMASGGGGIEGDPVLEIGNIGKEPVSLFSDMLDKTDDVLDVVEGYDLSDTDDIKSAIIDLYIIGCETWYNAPARGARYLGAGTAGISGKLEGKLKVFNERYYVKGDGTDDNPYPYYGIEEKHNYAYDVGDGGPIATVAANMLGSARRFVYMPSGDWKWEGVPNSTTMNAEGADANFSSSAPTYKTAAAVKEEKENEELFSHLGTGSAYYYYGDEIPDKSSYVLYESEAILGANDENGIAPKLTESTIDGKTVWTAEFAIDCASSKVYTKYAAHAIGKTIGSAKEIVYKKLTVKFELWETGYFRSWSATERWEGVSTSAVSGTGFAEVSSTEVYTYDIDEVTKVISEKAALVLKADPSKPDVSTAVSVKYNGKEVFK